MLATKATAVVNVRVAVGSKASAVVERIKDVVDTVFKLAVIAGIGVFLYLYACARLNGRYSYITNGELEYVAANPSTDDESTPPLK